MLVLMVVSVCASVEFAITTHLKPRVSSVSSADPHPLRAGQNRANAPARMRQPSVPSPVSSSSLSCWKPWAAAGLPLFDGPAWRGSLPVFTTFFFSLSLSLSGDLQLWTAQRTSNARRAPFRRVPELSGCGSSVVTGRAS